MIAARDLAACQGAARAADLDRICRETAFLVLAGHGVPETTTRAAQDAAAAFFAQPDREAEVVRLDGSAADPPVRSGPYLTAKVRSAGS